MISVPGLRHFEGQVEAAATRSKQYIELILHFLILSLLILHPLISFPGLRHFKCQVEAAATRSKQYTYLILHFLTDPLAPDPTPPDFRPWTQTTRGSGEAATTRSKQYIELILHFLILSFLILHPLISLP